TFELVVAGRETESGDDIAIMMVEAGGTEDAWRYYEDGAPKVTEEVIAAGLEAAKTWIREPIQLQREFVAAAGVRESDLKWSPEPDYGDDVYARVAELGEARLAEANTIVDKTERNAANDAIRDEIREALAEEFEGREREVSAAIKSLTKTVIRRRIVNEGTRIDGRGPTDIRPISCQVGLLPTAHGSALFQRGETQVLNVLTLGMPRMAMDVTYMDSPTPTEK